MKLFNALLVAVCMSVNAAFSAAVVANETEVKQAAVAPVIEKVIDEETAKILARKNFYIALQNVINEFSLVARGSGVIAIRAGVDLVKNMPEEAFNSFLLVSAEQFIMSANEELFTRATHSKLEAQIANENASAPLLNFYKFCLKHLVAILKNSNKDVITRQEAFQFFAAYVHRMTFEEKLAEIDAFAQVVVDIILDLTANQDITTKQDGRAR